MHLSYLFIAIYLAASILTVADCLRSNNQSKAGWIALIVFLPLLGPILYVGLAPGRFVSDL